MGGRGRNPERRGGNIASTRDVNANASAKQRIALKQGNIHDRMLGYSEAGQGQRGGIRSAVTSAYAHDSRKAGKGKHLQLDALILE